MVLDAVAARPSATRSRVFVSAPLPLALVSLGIGGALLLLDRPWVHIAGYAASCLLPFILVAFQRREAARLLAVQGIARPTRERFLASAILVVGFAVAVVHAWSFAWAVS